VPVPVAMRQEALLPMASSASAADLPSVIVMTARVSPAALSGQE